MVNNLHSKDLRHGTSTAVLIGVLSFSRMSVVGVQLLRKMSPWPTALHCLHLN